MLRKVGGLEKIGGVPRSQLEYLFNVLETSREDSKKIQEIIKTTAMKLAQIEFK